MAPGPVSAVAVAETPLAGPTTASWNASNSLRAACSAAEVAPVVAALALAAGQTVPVSGRIFAVAMVVQTAVARAAAGTASARASAATARGAWRKEQLP